MASIRSRPPTPALRHSTTLRQGPQQKEQLISALPESVEKKSYSLRCFLSQDTMGDGRHVLVILPLQYSLTLNLVVPS